MPWVTAFSYPARSERSYAARDGEEGRRSIDGNRVLRIRAEGSASVRGSKRASMPGSGLSPGERKLLVILPCVSVSMTRIFCLRSSATPARSQAVWVFPTPPLRLMTVMACARRSEEVDTEAW